MLIVHANFRKINFRSRHQPRKYFYNENFQIYGNSYLEFIGIPIYSHGAHARSHWLTLDAWTKHSLELVSHSQVLLNLSVLHMCIEKIWKPGNDLGYM